MAMPRQTKGTCSYCQSEIGKGTVAKHLDKCDAYQQVLTNAENSKSAEENLYHLRVQDAYNSYFWLDLEMRGGASLKTLDTYLRAIWLECCGHLSKFQSGGAWDDSTVGMARKADTVFTPSAELLHIYDYGTSSETTIKCVSVRQGKPTTKRPIALLVRNVIPEPPCAECEKPATHLCMECMIESEDSLFLCDQHLEAHPHDEYGEPIALVNSPCLGMCGYDGPAEPPYEN